LGAVLQVMRNDEWVAAAFYSRQTRGPERRYLASELEALAVVEAVKHFSPYLYGRPFTVFTDHKPLCHLLTSYHLNGRLKPLSTKLQPWMVTFQYLPGEENTLADAMSRQDWMAEDAGLGEDAKRDQMGGQVCERSDQEKKSKCGRPDLRTESLCETEALPEPQSGPGGCGGPAPQEMKMKKMKQKTMNSRI